MLDGTGARFVHGWVTAVDAEARTVRIDDDRVLPYDTLVYGLGGVADTSAAPGAEDHAYTLSSVPGMVFRGPDRVVAPVTFDFDAGGRITAIHNVANPDKLGAVAGGTAYDIGARQR